MDVLQIATGVTKCDDYYKLRQVLQSTMDVLQIATGITKCDDYYKLDRYILQSAMIITNCDSACALLLYVISHLMMTPAHVFIRRLISFLAAVVKTGRFVRG